eukprot:COSAG02_NODE_973_length_15536_cov_5.108635_4_plen_1513_part_00
MAAEGAKLPGSVYFAGVDEPQAGGTATARPKGGTEAEGAERPRGHGERLAKTGSSHTSFKTTRTQLRLSREVSPAGTGGTIASRSWLLSCDYTDESEVITTATHGQLSFKDGRGVLNPAAGSLEEARQARFMRVEVDPRKFADLTPPEQVERVTLFRGLVGFMQEAWQMDMPSVIFSVTGSAQEFTLRPKFRDTFMSALLNATRSTNAWIVTGGSDAGIMKLVGDTLARGKQMETAVGVASWSAVHGRTELSPSESKAQKELKRSMPACTIRVETTDSRAYTEEKLNEVLSRYGPVIGVSLAKSSSGTSLKRLLQKAMKSHSNLGDSANSASNRLEKTAFVTFRDPTSAENAARQQVLRFRISNSDPTPASLHCRLLEDEGSRQADDRQMYMEHEAKVLGQRGGPWLPFVYDGERGENEQVLGTRLNPNHSHYLLVDTGIQGFSQEIIFRSELLDFISFRHDAKKATKKSELENLASMIRGRSKNDKRSVPVVAFVYGGGPGTLTTILEHVRTCDPVIVVVGSGRAADLLYEWRAFRQEMEVYTKRFGGDRNHLMVRLNNAKIAERQSSRLRKWLLSLPGCETPTTQDQELAWQERMDSLRKDLDKICQFDLIYFFDFNQNMDPTVKIIKDSLLARQGSNPHLLSIVLKAIFRSPNVRDSIKLPLAVRYGDRYQVKQLMKKQGIEQGMGGDELTSDARPMVYAAFHNDHRTVQELLRHGTDVRCLDHLILTEFCALLNNRKILKSAHLSPPRSWLKEEVNRHLSVHKNEWISLSPEEQEQICLAQWATRSLQDQQKICCEDASKITWQDLPYLRGYQYKVLGSMEVIDDSEHQDSPAITTHDISIGTQPAIGTLFRQRKARHIGLKQDGAGIEIDLVSCSDEAHLEHGTNAHIAAAHTLVGRVITAGEASDLMSLVQQKRQSEPDASIDRVRSASQGIWVVATVTLAEKKRARVLLQQQDADEIARCLVLQHPSRWLLSKSTPGSIARALAAFRPWLPTAIWADGRIQKSWHSIHDSSCQYSWLSSQLHPLHRLYWAIQTGREELAQLFWRQSDSPLVASFLASYTYRQSQVYAKSHLRKLAMEYDAKAEALLEILSNVPELAGDQQMHVLMDEYAFFPQGEDIEQVVAGAEHGTMTQYGMLTDAEKKANAKTRSALALMGAEPTLAMTRLDLAIRAQNKPFMAHRATQEFLDSMWNTSWGNGQWLDTFLNTSPRTKFRIKLIGYILAILLLWAVFVQMPTASKMQVCIASQRHWCDGPQEWLLWLWWFGALVNEGSEYSNSHSLKTYLGGSGNQLDCAVILSLLFALCCRVVVVILGGTNAGAAVWFYRSMMMFLMLGVFAMSFRLLHMFSFSRRLGIIKIIVVRIITMDVVPFLLYLCVTLLSFEIGNTIFGWLHDVQLHDRAWGFSLIAFTESINDIRDSDVVETVDFGASIGGHQVSISVSIFREVFNMVFFVVTVVILMNVLSASQIPATPPVRLPVLSCCFRLPHAYVLTVTLLVRDGSCDDVKHV